MQLVPSPLQTCARARERIIHGLGSDTILGMHGAKHRLPLAALAATLLLASMAGVSAASQQAEGSFDDEVTVLEVEVPVRVLRAGVPVPGLSREDFEIRDRGVPQTITDFAAIDLREARLSESPGSPAAVRRDDRHNFLLVFDLNQLGPRAFLRARPKLEAWLQAPRGAAVRVAVAVHGSVDGRTPRTKSLHLLTPFTRDGEALRLALEVVARVYDRRPRRTEAALATLDAHQTRPSARADLQATVREIGVPAALQLLATPLGETSALGLLGDPRAIRGVPERDPFSVVPDGRGLFGDAPFRVSSGSADSRLRWLALAMAEAVTLLADLAGENNVVLITEPGYPGVDDSFTTERLEPMHNAFRRSGWTFHAVDASGVGFRGDTLFYMANETGGELLENQLDTGEALDRLALRTELTYRLTFRPSELGEPGSYHRLEVRLAAGDGPRTEVQHRMGYYAPRPDAEQVREADWFDVDSLLRGDHRLDESTLAVEVVPTDLGAAVAVGIDLAALLGAPRREAASLEVTIAAIGTDGAIAARHDERFETVASAIAVTRHASLALAPGHYRIRAFVRDAASGALALTTTAADIQAAEPRGGGGRS